MAQQTTDMGLTYPEAGDHTRLWEHFQQLAEDVDAAIAGSVDIGVTGGPYLIKMGVSQQMGPTGGISFIATVTFDEPFGPGPVRVLNPNLNTGAGGTAGWHCRAINASETGFTVVGYGPSAATFTASVTYLAIGTRP